MGIAAILAWWTGSRGLTATRRTNSKIKWPFCLDVRGPNDEPEEHWLTRQDTTSDHWM